MKARRPRTTRKLVEMIRVMAEQVSCEFEADSVWGLERDCESVAEWCRRMTKWFDTQDEKRRDAVPELDFKNERVHTGRRR